MSLAGTAQGIGNGPVSIKAVLVGAMIRITSLLPLFLAAIALASCSGARDAASDRAASKAPLYTPPYAETQRGARRSIPRQETGDRVADYLLVDKSQRLLIAYSAGRPIRAFRGIQFGDAPLGHKQFQGDERTPEGRYFIDGRNPQSRFHLSLRISYPNAEDKALAARYGRSPGGDIFIHGQPNQLSAGRMRGDWTDGCIALGNSEIEELWRIVPTGIPIDILP